MSSSIQQESGFFVAPFGIDGCSVGIAFWDASSLSEEWTAVCSAFLEEHGVAFDDSWGVPLSHVRMKLTSASGAAIVTFFVHDKAVSSVLLLSGQSPSVEADVGGMFIESLKRTLLVKAATVTPNAFKAVLECKERPLMAVVAWPESAVCEEDHELVRELGLHLAGAFFLR
ncbi:MAG: hypothetical protein H8E73_03190 [Planctomycetes bacterium]|nr:hypothetical protein [Planctomycetota bacterium]